MKKSTKTGLGIAAAAVLATTGTIVAFAYNSSDPANRPEVTCAGADHVVFNSIVDTVCSDVVSPLGPNVNEYYFAQISEEGSKEWHNDLKVEKGKNYQLRVYVHNTAVSDPDGDGKINDESTIAKNTTAKFVSVVTNGQQKNSDGKVIAGTDYRIEARISADNATPKMVQSEVLLHSANGQPFKLNFVQAHYYSSLNGGTKIGDLNGAELFGNGAKIGYEKLNGEIPGCTKYSGWVYATFSVEMDEQEKTPSLTIEKEVKNVTKGGDYAETIHANAGDELKYRIYIKNNGSEATPVYLNDVMDNELEGSNYYVKYGKCADGGKCETVKEDLSDSFMHQLTAIKIVEPGADLNIFYTAKVKNQGLDELCKATHLPNRAELHYKKDVNDKTESWTLLGEDTATVIIDGKECHESFALDKYAQLAKDDPKDESTWHNDGSLKAARGENVRFRIRFFNTGDVTLPGVKLRDPLADTGFKLDGSKKITLTRVENGKDVKTTTIKNLDNIEVGDVPAGQTVVLMFEAYVPANDTKETLVCEDTKLINYAYGKYGDYDESKTDEVVIITADDCDEDEKHPGYIIEKFVQVKGDKEFAKKVYAKAGDTVRYQIKFKNTGETVLERFVVSDQLDSRLTYVKGSTTVLRNGKEQKIESDEITTKGVVIGDYAPGEEAIVYFYAVVSASLADNCEESMIPNTATGKYNNDDSTRKSTDEVKVEVAGKICEEPGEPELPKTGASSAFGIIAGIASVSTAAAYYINSRKKLN